MSARPRKRGRRGGSGQGGGGGQQEQPPQPSVKREDLMAKTVARHRAELERISFKGTVDALRQYSAVILQARNRKMRDQLWQDLLLNLVRDLVPYRPNRYEPRAVKHRPKPFALLNKPRRLYKEVCHRSHYSKSNPRNYRALN